MAGVRCGAFAIVLNFLELRSCRRTYYIAVVLIRSASAPVDMCFSVPQKTMEYLRTAAWCSHGAYRSAR